jgi:hypothetical protein
MGWCSLYAALSQGHADAESVRDLLAEQPFDEAARGARFPEEKLADSLPRAEREVLGENRSLSERRVAE